MITTTLRQRANRLRLSTLPPLLSGLALLLVVVGCTNNKLLVGPLYNQLDDKIRAEFDKLGDFTASQTAAFEQALGTFHVWHRQSELPRYAELLQDIASSITEPEHANRESVVHWVNTAEAFSRSARECYPANFLAGTIRTLSDEQIDTIEKRLNDERRKNRERYESRTPEQRITLRLKRLEKWASRIDLELNPAQLDALRASLARQTPLRQQYTALSDAWYSRLFALARNQQDEHYETQIQTHFAKLWTRLESSYPDEWQSNRQLLQEAVQELVLSLDAQQRRSVSRWLGKMGSTLQAVSRDKPSFTPGSDASVGCLVQTDS